MTGRKNKTNGNTLSRNKRLFLEKYPEYGTVGATMKAIGLKRRGTFYRWCDEDPGFKEFYLSELLPNRRDDVASVVYRAGTGRLGTYKEVTTRRNGDVIERELPVGLPQTQLTAAFAFLKATDHNEDPAARDRLVFTEKYQHELAGRGGGPLEVDVDVKGKLISLLNRIAARDGAAEGNTGTK